MIKINSAFIAAALMIFSSFFEGNRAEASESKAQLHLPWALLNTRLQAAVGANSSTVSVEIPAFQLEAAGVKWNLNGVVVNSRLGSNSAAIIGSSVGIRSTGTGAPIQMNIGSIAVNQVIERIVNGVKVRVHLKASCGPLVLSQSSAQFSALFDIDWSTGSPYGTLRNFDLRWGAASWQVAPFECVGPAGLPAVLHEQISERLGNAEEFRPLLSQFLSTTLTEKVEQTLARIRQPFSVSSGQARHTFQIGRMTPIETGVLAEVAVASPMTATGAGSAAGSSGAGSQSRPYSSKSENDDDDSSGVPESAIVNFAKLPIDRPSLLGGIDLINQIFRAEISAQPYYFTIDLQKNKSFHDLMQSRFMQFFVFSDLMNYKKDSPFALQIFRPEFSDLSVLDTGNLRTSFPLSGVVQSFRDSKWWSYLTLKGDTKAEVRLSVAGGSLTYETALSNKGVDLEYGVQYKAAYKKKSSPPDSIAKSALKGKQEALSGTVVWPVVDLGIGGQYKIDSFEWIDKSQFILHWR